MRARSKVSAETPLSLSLSTLLECKGAGHNFTIQAACNARKCPEVLKWILALMNHYPSPKFHQNTLWPYLTFRLLLLNLDRSPLIYSFSYHARKFQFFNIPKDITPAICTAFTGCPKRDQPSPADTLGGITDPTRPNYSPSAQRTLDSTLTALN